MVSSCLTILFTLRYREGGMILRCYIYSLMYVEGRMIRCLKKIYFLRYGASGMVLSCLTILFTLRYREGEMILRCYIYSLMYVESGMVLDV